MVNIKIEGVSYQVEEGLTILEAAKKCGYEIPSLCAFNHGECNNGSCRVCLVEVKGARGLVASCVYPLNEGMEIIISSPKASEARRASVELLLSNHNQNCQQCDKNGKCELLQVNGLKDVDAVLTTRELARMIKRAGILFTRLPDEEFDQDLMGDYTGAGVIFGVTGGVMEAALRTVYFVLTGKEHEAIKFEQVRGFEGIREASLDINGMTVNVAIAHGMKNAQVLLDEIRAGTSKYHFIEIMGCPGGCIAGGGQPIVRSCFLPNEDDDILDTYKQKRANALYSEDKRQQLRQSHKNPQVQKLYDEFLGAPNSHKAHELLHTHYQARIGFND